MSDSKSYPKVLLGLIMLVLIAFIPGLTMGQVSLSFSEIWQGLMGPADDPLTIIVRELRLPRVMLAFLVGAGLAISGAALQGLLRNPLADPGVIGVSASAGFGAVLVIHLGLASVSALALPLAAMIMAGVSTLVLIMMARRRDSLLMLILAGIAISSLMAAATSLVLNLAETPMTLRDMMMWLMGSLENRTYQDVMLAGPFIIAGAAILASTGRGLTALSLGEETARSLGIHTGQLRLSVILGTALIVGASVAVSGAIGFIGLVTPHLMRRWVGNDPGRLLLPSALAGGLLLMIADLLTRLPFAAGGGGLRLGVVTALIGAPVFLFILFSLKGRLK